MDDSDIVPIESQANIRTQFDVIYAAVLRTIDKKNLSVIDLISLTTSAMVIVQKYPEMSGETKKRIVIDIIKHIVDDSDIFKKGEEEEAVKLFIEITLPVLIDTVVNVYNHNIDLEKISNTVQDGAQATRGCMSNACSCF